MVCGSHIKIWNLAIITWKEWNKVHQTHSFQFFINKSSILMFFVLFLHVVCSISNLNMWTTKHLAQASCTELTLILKNFANSQTLFWIIRKFLLIVGRNNFANKIPIASAASWTNQSHSHQINASNFYFWKLMDLLCYVEKIWCIDENL